LGVPLTLLVVTPPAIFLVFAWRPLGRSAPVAGSACFLALATLALAGWLVPLSVDLMNTFVYQSFEALTPESDLSSHLSRGQAVLAVTGWAGLAGASAICAAAVARRSPLRSRWWLAAVPAIYLALIPGFTLAIGTSFIVLRSAGDPPLGFRPGVAAWTTTALAMTAAMIFGRRARQHERSV
jgi:hypothetical protein